MTPRTFHLIPHTHWDREWYLTRAAFQARWIAIFDAVLDQLEQDPDARFVLDGQSILLEDYLAFKPGSEARIRTQVERGALEIGPWYVLSDLLIPGAVSLRRNLAEGALDCGRFGKRLEVLYSPDAFGHPAHLPALAAAFGLHRAVIRRGLGRPEGRDRDLWRWEADGHTLLVHHLPAGGYDAAIGLAGAGKELAAIWSKLRRELVSRAACGQVAVFLGADHHAMVRNLSGLRARLQALEPRDAVRISGLTEFFDQVELAKPELPVLRGELRAIDGHTWVLPGVHSTRARMKRVHTEAELLLGRIAEPLARIAETKTGIDRNPLLTAAWRTLLQCQFHDTLAGTTSDAVQAEQDVRLEATIAIAREIATRSLRDIAGYDPDAAREHREEQSRLVLWNPGSHLRGGVTTAELTFFRSDVLVGPPGGGKPRTGRGHAPFALVGPEGDILPVQVLRARRGQERRDFDRHYPDQDEVDRVWVAFAAPEIAAAGTATLTPTPLPRAAGDIELARSAGGRYVSVGGNRLENGFLSVQASPTGVLTLHDQASRAGYSGGALLIDEPDRGDLYTRSAGTRPPVTLAHPLSQSVLASGPLVGAIETAWWMPSAGTGWIGVRQVVALHADSPVLRIRLDLDHYATDHRLRIRFPVGAGASGLRGSAFGAEEARPGSPDTGALPIEHPTATAPAHRFVWVGDGARGLAVCSTGFFEAELTSDSTLIVTLLRAVGELARAGLRERPGRAGWPLPTPSAQEPGRHTIHLALKAGPAAGADQSGELERIWEEVFLPIQSLAIRGF